MRIHVLLASFLFLASCGSKDETVTPTPLHEVEAVEVTAGDELGGFDVSVNGIGFWTHPSVAFNGMMLVATDIALTSYNIEDGTKIDEVTSINPDGLSIAYQGAGATARGVLAIFDSSETQFRFYTIDNIDRSFVLAPSLMVAEGEVSGFCLGRRTGDNAGLALYAIGPEKITAYDLLLSGAGVSAEASTNFATPAPMTDCAVDALDGAVFALAGNGDVFRFENGVSEEAPFAISGANSAVNIGLSYSGLVEGAPTDECCGHITVLDSSTGRISIFDRDDGHALGVTIIGASFDVAAVTEAAVMGVGYGNFGSTNRNGVLALATPGTEPVVRIVPWSGIINALGQPLGEPANPRRLAAPEDDKPKLDLNVLDL